MSSLRLLSLGHLGTVLAWQGDTAAARAAADASLQSGPEFGGMNASVAYFALAIAALAAGDVATALDATAAGWEHASFAPGFAAHLRPSLRGCHACERGSRRGPPLGRRSRLDGARRGPADAGADHTRPRGDRTRLSQSRLSVTPMTRSRALAEVVAYLCIPDILECLGTLAGDAGSHREAARLFGAAAAIRQRMGAVRFKVYDAGYEASVAALRDALSENDFDIGVGRGRGPVHRGSDRLRPARPRPTQTTHQRLGVTHADRAGRRATRQRRTEQ